MCSLSLQNVLWKWNTSVELEILTGTYRHLVLRRAASVRVRGHTANCEVCSYLGRSSPAWQLVWPYSKHVIFCKLWAGRVIVLLLLPPFPLHWGWPVWLQDRLNQGARLCLILSVFFFISGLGTWPSEYLCGEQEQGRSKFLLEKMLARHIRDE